MKAIEAKNLSFKYYGNKNKILSSVNFYANYGEITLLSGNSGEGKSTLLSLICGIIPNIIRGDIDGDILIDGISIKGRKLSEVCRRVGIVLQNADNQIIHKIVEDEITKVTELETELKNVINDIQNKLKNGELKGEKGDSGIVGFEIRDGNLIAISESTESMNKFKIDNGNMILTI